MTFTESASYGIEKYLVQGKALTANLNNNVSRSISGHAPAMPEQQKSLGLQLFVELTPATINMGGTICKTLLRADTRHMHVKSRMSLYSFQTPVHQCLAQCDQTVVS